MDVITTLIAKTSYTLSDFQARLSLLKSYYDHKFFNSPFNPEGNDKSWLANITPELDSLVNPTNYKSLFQKIETWCKSLEPMILSLPLKLSEQQLREVGERVRREFGPGALFELKYQPELVGGAVLIWKGKYYDYSIKKRLAESKEQLEKIIKGYFS